MNMSDDVDAEVVETMYGQALQIVNRVEELSIGRGLSGMQGELRRESMRHAVEYMNLITGMASKGLVFLDLGCGLGKPQYRTKFTLFFGVLRKV